MLSNKFLNLYLECKKQHLFGSVNCRVFGETALRAGNFENFCLSFSCGRANLEYDYHKSNNACPVRHAIVSIVPTFSCGQAKAIRIRYVWTRIFFENGGKNCPFPKISGYVSTRPKNHRSRAFDSLFDDIPTVHPYLCFKKYPDTCERRLKTYLSRAFYSIFFFR